MLIVDTNLLRALDRQQNREHSHCVPAPRHSRMNKRSHPIGWISAVLRQLAPRTTRLRTEADAG